MNECTVRINGSWTMISIIIIIELDDFAISAFRQQFREFMVMKVMQKVL